MWEKISKEMAIPWRAAEAMHWQLGEVEMASRANVSVFHLAGQQNSQSVTPAHTASVSPPVTQAVAYSHTHNHSLPQMPTIERPAVSAAHSRLRRNSVSSSASGPSPLRRRADSARSVPPAGSSSRTLPPVGEIVGPARSRYTLPPVITSSNSYHR